MREIKYFIFFLTVFSLSIAYGQSINELPLYGGMEKSDSQKKEDSKFVKFAVQQMGSREKATQHIIERGWQALSNNDIKTSIKRFNQAWLINPNNGQIYWGLGVAQAKQYKYESAVELFEIGNSIIKENPRFLADYGHAVIRYAIELDNKSSEVSGIYKKGIDILKNSIGLNPNLADAYFFLAVAEYNKENYREAWKNVHIAQKKGYSEISIDFLKALKQKMPDPNQ